MSSERTANAVDAWLGQRVRARRVEVGLSQERLADLLGITFQQVQKYERGVNRIAATRLFEICKVLTVPIEDLLEGLGREPGDRAVEAVAVAKFLTTAEGIELAMLFLSLRSQAVRRRVLQLLRTLSNEQAAMLR
ncbi:MAG: helix-turn-helix transcriptional regulator [Terricaulis sp.]